MDTVETEFSLMLWMLGVLVAGLAAQLAHGWLRLVRHDLPTWRHWRKMLLAASVLGLGMASAVELGLQAQAFHFPVGYRWLALALLPAAIVAMLPAVVVLAAWTHGLACLVSGVLMGAAVLGLQWGWIWAAGFRPGLVWQSTWVAAAAVWLTAGLAVALWLAFAPDLQTGSRRRLWRLGATGLMAVTVMTGQQFMALAAGLADKGASQFSNEIPGTVASMVAGVVVPLVLVALLLDLWLRRQQRREQHRHPGHGDFNPTPRRKRRHKIRTL